MDRMALCARCTNDIHLDVQRVPHHMLTAMDGGETSASIRSATPLRRVEATRERQQARFAELEKPSLFANGDMGGQQAGLAEAQTYCELERRLNGFRCSNLIGAAVKQMDPSERAYHRVPKFARTNADLACDDSIQSRDLAEALQYWLRAIGQGT